MTDWYAPNQQAVGVDIAGGEVAPGSAEFDPGDHTVAEVQAYIDANPDDRDRVLTAEQSGKNRTTLVSESDDE